MGKIFEFTAKLLTERKHSKIWHRISTLIACLVVFTTTYSMILPALTFDEVTASEEPGFDMGAAENEQEAVPVEDVSQNEYYEEEPIQNDSNYTEDYTVSTGSADSGELIVEEEPTAVPAADTTNVYDNTVPAEEAGFAPEGDGEAVDFSDTEEAETVLTYEDAEVRLTASFEDPTYEIPAGLTLKVAPIAYGSEQWSALNDGANERLTEIGNYVISYSAYYDIWFELNNETVIPALNVKLEAQYKNRDLGETGVKLFSYNYDGNAITLHDDVTWGVYDDSDPTWPWRSSFTFRTHGGDVTGHTIAGLLNTEVVEKETAEDEAEVSEEEAAVSEENAEPETTIEETATEETVPEETPVTEEAVIENDEFLEEDEFELANEDIVPVEETEDELTEAEAVGDAAADDEAAAEETSEEADSEEASLYKVGQIVYNGSDYTVELNVPEEAHIPSDAELKVDEIDPESDAYKEYYDQAMAAINEEGRELEAGFARFFDIRFEKDDVEIEPNPLARIDVKINFAQTVDQQNETETENAQTGEVSAVHFAENEVQEIEVEAETQGDATDVAEITFEASSFSVFGFIYTVDFETVDGGKFSVPGKGSYKLNDLLPSIINKEGLVSKATLELVEGEDIAGALYLTQDENEDWYINSDVAFTSTYLLSMMVDGVKYEVKVTDAPMPNYTDLTSLADVDANIKASEGGNQIDGSTFESTKTFHADISFEVNNATLFNQVRAASGDTIKLDYDLTGMAEGHETLASITGSGTLTNINGPIGTFRVEDGHLLIDLDKNKVTDVDTAQGDLTINIQIDRTKSENEGKETFTFPGDGGSFEITWPEKKHGAGTKSVDHDSDTIYPGENEDEYLEYNYTLTLDGGTDLSALNLSDYLPEGMELKGGIGISCETTTTTQTSTRAFYEPAPAPGGPAATTFGLWSAWTSGASTTSTTPGTITSPNISNNKITANIWQALGFSSNPDSTGSISYTEFHGPQDQAHAIKRERQVTTSKYTLTYTARIKRKEALRLIGEGKSISLKNTVTWNEGTDNIPGGEVTVTINKGELNPGQKAIEPSNSERIQVKTEDIINVDGNECVVVAYAVTINEPIDANSAVLADKLSEYQTLYTGDGAPELYINDQFYKNVTLTPSGRVITYNLHNDLPDGKFLKNTKYTIRYKTLVKKEDFGKSITNETDWTIGGVPVDGEDKTTIIEKLPPKQGEKWHNRSDTHVTGDGPWEIPWEIKTFQEQTFNDVKLSDEFSTDQTLNRNSFIIKIGNTEYKLADYPGIASYISYPAPNKFEIDFDGLLKYLTNDNSNPAFKAQTDYRVIYTTTTSQYDDPNTQETEKSINHSQWTYDGDSDTPTKPEITLIKDEYKPGDKKVKSEEGSAAGSNWTKDGEAEVEAITIAADDNKIDLTYKITLNEPMEGVSQATLTDTYSNLEQLDTENMVIHHKGRDYPVPADLITRSGNTFTVDFVAVMRRATGNSEYTLEKNQDYELRYNTSIPLTDEVKQLLKTKEIINGTEVIKGLTVENHQTWHFDGPNGPEDKPGEPVEYTFKEKPYNGGDKEVAVWNNDSGEWMTNTFGKEQEKNGTPVYGDFEENRNAGITVIKTDSGNNTLHYTISLTEHRNANQVILRDQYYRNQILDTNSFTVKFRQNGRMHTIEVPVGSIDHNAGNKTFSLDLVEILEAEGFSFTPEVEYIIEYDATVSETGNSHGGDGSSWNPGEGDGFDNVATWDFGEDQEPGGETEVHLDIPDYLPGTKTVAVREEVAGKTAQTSDWNYWYNNGNPENIQHDDPNFHISKVVDEPTDLEDGGYHLDYIVTIYEERPITSAVLTDTFKGSAQQTLLPGSFKLQIDRDGTWIEIPAAFVDASNPTVGYTLNLTDFLTSIEKKFEKYTYYDIQFTTKTTVNGNIAGSGDGQDNRADWRLNDEVDVVGGHTEAHIEKVPHLDKTYYNKDKVEKGEVDFGEQVTYVITYGDPGQVLNGKELRDSMTNYHHVDTTMPVTVYTNYNKETGTGTEIASDLLTAKPNGWEFYHGNQDQWNDSVWDSVLYIKFPNLADDQSNKIEGPVTIVYTAIVGTKEQTGIIGTRTVTNKVRSEDIEIHTDFDLKAGTVLLDKTALPIEDDILEANGRKVWWTVDVTPVEMSLNGLRLVDATRFSTNSAEDARNGTNTQNMNVDTSTYEIRWKNDSVNPAPNEEGGHYAGDKVPSTLYQIDNTVVNFIGDITEPIQVKFATRDGNYSYGSIYLYNKARITDNNWRDVAEPDDAEKQLVEEGEVTAEKSFDEEKTVIDGNNKATIYWTITINTTETATVNGYTLAESIYTLSTTSVDDAKTSTTDWSKWLTFDTNNYPNVVITDKDGHKLTKNVDYKLENGIKFLKRLQGPLTVTVPMEKTNFPMGTVWLYNKAILKSPDGSETPVEGTGEIENSNLKVDKTIETSKDNWPKAPDFDEIIQYQVVVNGSRDAMPDGDITFVDVLPAGMEYVDDNSFYVSFNYNGTQYSSTNNHEIWEDLKPSISTQTLSDGRQQQTLTVDFVGAARKHNVTFSLNGIDMQVKYKARLSESERNRLKTIGTGAPQIYDNHVVVTQGEKNRGEDTTEWDYTWDNGLKKEDITDDVYQLDNPDNLEGANIYYKININPEGRQMNKGNDLILSDRIETSMELNTNSVKVYRHDKDSVTGAITKVDVTDDDNIAISYDGITRYLTVTVPDNDYYTVEFYAEIENPYEGMVDTFTNTATLTGESTWRSTVEKEHKVETLTGHFSYTVPGGFIIKKFDGNKITHNLAGAEFTLYKANFPALANLEQVYTDYANYDRDKNSVEFDLSPFVLSGQDLDPVVTYSNASGLATFSGLKVNELYFWMETNPPEGGYSAGEFANPQYVILFTNNKDSDPNSEAHARLLDHLISDANGITVNNAAESFVWYATNTKYVQYKAEKIWKDNNDEAGLRPDSIWLQLYQNGQPYDDPDKDGNQGLVEVKVDNLGDWNYTWYKLPAADDEGEDYVYDAKELTPSQMLEAGVINEDEKEALERQLADYTTIYRSVTGGIEITNRMKDDSSLFVKKVWDDENNVSKLRPGYIEVYLYRETIGGSDVGQVVPMGLNNNGEVIQVASPQAIKIYANDNWQAEFEGLVTENNGNAYRYFLVEKEVDGYDATYQDPYTAHLTGGSTGGTAAGIADSEGVITITNKLNTARATKRWLDETGQEVWTKDVTFKLMKRTAEGNFEDVTTPRYYRENGIEWSQTITTTRDKRTAIWNHLDELGENEAYFAIEYQIADVNEEDIERNEEGAAMSFTLNDTFYDVTGGASSSGTGTIINSPRINKQFTKIWENTTFDDSDAPNNRKNLKLQVQLIRINRADGQIDREFNTDAQKYPEGQPITITYDNSGGTLQAGSKTIVLPENPDEDATWTFEWKDLPITVWSDVNDESIEYVYKVQEVKVLDAAGDDITSSFEQTQDKDDEWKYTNKYTGQSLKISKIWSPEPEGDWSITAKLKVEKRLVEQNGEAVTPAEWTGVYEDYEVDGEVQTIAIGKKDRQPMSGVSYDEATGKYTRVISLPRFLVDEPNKQVYELKFTAVEGEVNGEYQSTVEVDEQTGEVTITNEKPVTDIEVEKKWEGDITEGSATMVLYQAVGKKAEDLEAGETDPSKPSDKISVTIDAKLNNATNKNAVITVNYTGKDAQNADVSGSFTLSNEDGWKKSVELERGGTYSFTYTADGTNIKSVSPTATADITTSRTIELAAVAEELQTYQYTFTVPVDERPTSGSIDVTCNGSTQTANADNDWTVSFDVVEEEEVTYSGEVDGKFVTGVTFDPETLGEASKHETINMHPTVAALTMDVPVSVTWNVNDPKSEEVNTVVVTFTPDKTGVATETLEIAGGETNPWSSSKTLPRLDGEGNLITWTVSAAAVPADGGAAVDITSPASKQISDSGSVSVEGEIAREMNLKVITEGSVNIGGFYKAHMSSDGTLSYSSADSAGTVSGNGATTTVDKLAVKDETGPLYYVFVLYSTAAEITTNAKVAGYGNATENVYTSRTVVYLKAQAGDITLKLKDATEWSVNFEQSRNQATSFASKRNALRAPAVLKAAPTPSTLKTFYDPTVTGADGNLTFTVVKFKDLPEGATPVTGQEVKTVTGTEQTPVKWSDLPQLDSEGNPIYYYVVEKDASAKADTMEVSYEYQYNPDGTIKKVIITNTTTGVPEPELGSIIVKKTFKGVDDSTDLTALQNGLRITVTGKDVGGEGVDTLTLNWSDVQGTGKTIDNLPLDEKYQIEESYTDETGTVLAKYEVASDTVASFADVSPAVEGVIKELINSYTIKPGSLKLIKTVSVGDATDKTFTFQVALTPKSGTTIDTTVLKIDTAAIATENISVTENIVTITATITGAGETTISGIPAGTGYVVTEPSGNLPAGWSQVGEVTYSNTTKVIKGYDTESATIANTYEADGTLDFSAKKVFTNGTLGTPSFTFKLTQVTGENSEEAVETSILTTNPVTVSTTATTGDTQTVSFPSITLKKDKDGNQEGTYWFLLEEVLPEGVTPDNPVKDGIKYDTTQKWIEVTVEDDKEGTLNVTKDPEPEEDEPDGTWTNKQLGSLEITKTIQKGGAQDTTATGTFYYAVYAEADVEEGEPKNDAEAVRTGSITIGTDDDGTATAQESNLPFGKYYVYELTEENGTPIISGENGQVQKIGNSVYTVTESGTEASITSTTAAEAELINDVDVTEIHVTKVWNLNGVDTTEPGDDIDKVTFRLVRKGTDTEYISCESGYPVKEKAQLTLFEITKSGNKWSEVDITELPVDYKAADNSYAKYTYYVEEVGVYAGETEITGWSPSYKLAVTKAGLETATKISSSSTDLSTYAIEKGYIEIKNTKSDIELPHTGGRGTLPFTVSGSILLAFSALMYVTSFRRRQQEALARTGGYFEGDAEREAMRGGGSRR